MLTEINTNTVCFTEDLHEEFPDQVSELSQIIKSADYKVKVLEEVEGFLCREVMPTQVRKSDFIRFASQQTNDEHKYIYDSAIIANINQLPTPRVSTIILGNSDVVGNGEITFISDHILKYNLQNYSSAEQLIKELERVLQSKVILLPDHPYKDINRVRQMVRFVDKHCVLINSYIDEESEWYERFFYKVEQQKLVVVEIPKRDFSIKYSTTNNYLCYLQVGKLIIIPEFENRKSEDDLIVNFIRNTLPPGFIVKSYPSWWIAKLSGSLDQIGWAISQ